jgi:hypothetical protein
MIETSDFITPESEEELFERIEPLQANGITSLSYLVVREGKQFFMKQLRPEHKDNPRYILIFKKEFAIGQRISHPNIVDYKEIGENSEGIYILTEYVTGETVEEKLANDPDYFRNNINLDNFFRQLLDALGCLHSHNIVYCDLKPANIMLTRINNNVKIIDLGFCDTDDYAFSAGMSENYAAPEQLQKASNKLDTRTDIYALGRLLQHIEKRRGRRLPSKYRSIMKRCLNEDKAKRFGSIEEVTNALNKKSGMAWKIAVSIAALCILITGWLMFLGTDSHRRLMVYMEKDATVNGIHYKILSEDNATCMVTGRPFNFKKDTRSGEKNLYIKEKIEIDGKTYTTTAIADSAFYNYIDNASVNLPASLKVIGDNAFYRNYSLASVNIPDGITETMPKCFYATGIRSVKLPKSLKFIRNASFAICKKLESIDIPEGVETLELDAFGECISLKYVKLPSTLKTINRGVFWKCRSLKEITIPASVETIGEYAFFHCDSLKHVYNYSPEPQSLSVIFNRKGITIHVPAASAEEYRKAQHWKDQNIVGDL